MSILNDASSDWEVISGYCYKFRISKISKGPSFQSFIYRAVIKNMGIFDCGEARERAEIEDPGSNPGIDRFF